MKRPIQKKIIFHPQMMPRVVISDPELTVGLPRAVTAATGIDAFVHCFEAFCAPGFHPLADGIALDGMRLIHRYLPRACADGKDIEARAHMLAAASMGATAFQKGLGGVHAIAAPRGGLVQHPSWAHQCCHPSYVITFQPNRDCRQGDGCHWRGVLDLPRRGFDGFLDWCFRCAAISAYAFARRPRG